MADELKQRELKLLQSCRDGNFESVDFHLSRVSVDVTDHLKKTPLMLASMYGHQDIVELILDHGADVNYARPRDGRTALMLASMEGHDKVAELLIKRGANVNNVDRRGRTALMFASKYWHQSVVTLLIYRGADVNVRDWDGTTPLMFACEKGWERVAGLLVERGADVNAISQDRITPLTLACRGWNKRIVELLIKHGADMTLRDWNGDTALMEACRLGKKRMVDLLIQRDSTSVNSIGWRGQTPLIIACEKGRENLIELLLRSGSDVNVTDNFGKTALVSACKYGNTRIIKTLVEHGADLKGKELSSWLSHRKTTNWVHFNVVELLIELGVRLSNQDVFDTFMMACERGNYKVIRFLIDRGVAVDARDENGLTGLMRALYCGKDNIHYERIVELLVQRDDNENALLDAREKERGLTAVMIAVVKDKVKCLRKLLSLGPNLDLVDKRGRTVFDHAMTNNNAEHLKLLLKEGNLLTEGRLRPVHKIGKSVYHLKHLLVTIEAGVFEWEWCPEYCYGEVSLAALENSFCPGKIGHENLSPLILSLFNDDFDLTKTFLKHHYYFPEDYKILISSAVNDICFLEYYTEYDDEDDMIGRITFRPFGPQMEKDTMINEITRQPLSLQTWSFLTASKSISMAGPPGLRSRRVNALSISDRFKKKLNFKL